MTFYDSTSITANVRVLIHVIRINLDDQIFVKKSGLSYVDHNAKGEIGKVCYDFCITAHSQRTD